MKKTASTFLFALVNFVGWGQTVLPVDSAFTVDRPGIAESTYTVPVKRYQFESGMETYYRGDQQLSQLPVTYFRTGITNNCELRVAARFYQLNSSKAISDSLKFTYRGLSPLALGLKVTVCKEKGIRPDFCVLSHFYLPQTASLNFKTSHIGQDFLLLFQNTLSDKLLFNYNVGGIWNGEDQLPTLTYSLCFSLSLGEKASVFAEQYAYWKETNLPELGADAGVTFMPGEMSQFDVSAGISYQGEQRYGFLALGFSFALGQ